MEEGQSIQAAVDTSHANLHNEASSVGEVVEKRWGGRRPNQFGRPVGSVSKKTLEQRKVQAEINQRIMQNADKLFNAALSLAVGQQVLMVVVTEGEGKNAKRHHEMVTDPEIIKQYLDWNEGIGDNNDPSDENHYYYLTTKPPDIRAIDSLMNRGLGKAPDKLEITGGFFSKTELTVKVVGSQHERDILDIGEDGQVVDPGDGSGPDPVGETGPSVQTLESPTSS